MRHSGIRVLLAGQTTKNGLQVRDASRALPLRVQLDTSVALRTSTYLDHTYLIVPVISQVGDTVVWPANAPTPEFIPADVLQLATESRNNHPVVVGHPMSGSKYISANDPDTLAKYAIGHVFNARYSDGRVKAEMWISQDRAEALPDADLRSQALDAIQRISSGEMVEVSEGNYVVIEDEKGTHDGQEYSGRWVLAIPDHLAILPEGTEGACSVANHGCGAPRVNQVRPPFQAQARNNETPAVHQSVAGVRIGSDSSRGADHPAAGSVPQTEPRALALSQARTPTYTGTEPLPARWTVPSFAQYVRYLYPGDSATAPRTVSACDSALKVKIAAHSLLGDPAATSFRDLTLLPVVNPASGKLNERALRAVLSRTSLSGVSDSTLISAQDVARRLLNAEFPSVTVSSVSLSSTNPEVRTMKKPNPFTRLMSAVSSVFRTDQFASQIGYALAEALSDAEPAFYYIHDYDPDDGIVVYCTLISYPDYDSERAYWQRTFTRNEDGSITLNDDAVEGELGEPTFIPKPDTSTTSDASLTANSGCSCHQHDLHKGDLTTMANLRDKLIGRIVARSCNRLSIKTLEKMDDDELLAMDEQTQNQEKEENSNVNPDGTTGDGGKSTPTPAANPLPSENPKTEVNPVPPEEQIRAQAKTITLTTDQYLALKAQADAQAAIENEKKEAVLQTLSAVVKVTDAMKALPLADLESLAESYGAIGGLSIDYSGARVNAVSTGNSGLPPGWEGYETPDTYGLRAQAQTAQAAKKGAN